MIISTLTNRMRNRIFLVGFADELSQAIEVYGIKSNGLTLIKPPYGIKVFNNLEDAQASVANTLLSIKGVNINPLIKLPLVECNNI